MPHLAATIPGDQLVRPYAIHATEVGTLDFHCLRSEFGWHAVVCFRDVDARQQADRLARLAEVGLEPVRPADTKIAPIALLAFVEHFAAHPDRAEAACEVEAVRFSSN